MLGLRAVELLSVPTHIIFMILKISKTKLKMSKKMFYNLNASYIA